MPHRRPRRFDANLVVLGGGSAGLVSAYVAAALRAKVVLIEEAEMGGDCLNTGCVPSKALIAAARRTFHAAGGAAMGVRCPRVEVDFAAVMAHVRAARDAIAPNDSMERYRALGVECIAGRARFLDPWTIEVGDRTIRARNVVIATGAEPAAPPIAGLDAVPYRTSETLWEMERLPERLSILGGGPIGCELAQAFSRLGSRVTIVEMQDRLLGAEDAEVSKLLQTRLQDEGVRVLTGARAERVAPRSLVCATGDGTLEVVFDELLVATGRRARVSGFGLEDVGVRLAADGVVAVNPFLQTNHPHVFACGDVAGPYQFTHAASHQAWHATVNALFRPLRKFRVTYDCMPWTIYTEPEIARVGLNEGDAARRAVAFETTRFPMSELDRAVVEGETCGFVKVLTAPRRDRILGATVVGHGAGELIGPFTYAMQNGLGFKSILSTIVPYPGWNEAPKRSAGLWRSDHAPAAVLTWLKRFHRLMRRV